MGRTCPVCGKVVQNMSSHLSRVHKLDGPDRGRIFTKIQKDSLRFSPYPMVEKTNCERFQLLHPFTALVAGMTGSGKTVWVQTLIEHRHDVIKPPPQRIVWSYSQWQPAYDTMIRNVPGIEFVKGIPHELDEEWYFNPKINNLMVIDDQMAETSNDKRILNLFTKGSHHRNLSVIFLVQNVYFQGKIMRTLSLNASYLVLFKNPRDKLQMMTLGKQMYPGKSSQFVQKYEAAVQRPYGYLFVDLKPNTKDECRLRTNVLPNDSQIGGQSDEMKAITDYIKRQSYSEPPAYKILQDLEEKMDAILKNPSMPPDVKIKEHEQLLNRYFEIKDRSYPIAPREEFYQIPTRLEEMEPSLPLASPPRNAVTTPVVPDSGIEMTAKQPSLLQRIGSKLTTPFKASTPQEKEIIPEEESSFTFPPTPPSSRERPSKNPRWIQYKDADQYTNVYEPPRRSERIKLMMKSIPTWQK